MLTKENKKLLLLTSLFSCLYIIANIMSNKIIQFDWFTVTAGAICYPFTFIIANIITKNYGQKTTGYAVKIALIAQVIVLLITTLVLFWPSPTYAENSYMAYRTLFGYNFRTVLASLTSFTISQKLNAMIYVKVCQAYDEELLQNLTSNVLSILIDNIIFISLAFMFIMPTYNLVIMLLSQYLFQSIWASIFIICSYFIVKNKKRVNC